MALYESVIIGRQDLTLSQFETLIEEFISVLKSQEGDVKKRLNTGDLEILHTKLIKIEKVIIHY